MIALLALLACTKTITPQVFSDAPPPMVEFDLYATPPATLREDDCTQAMPVTPETAIDCHGWLVPITLLQEAEFREGQAFRLKDVYVLSYEGRLADREHAQAQFARVDAEKQSYYKEARFHKALTPAAFLGGVVVGGLTAYAFYEMVQTSSQEP